jgi:hypothetical protein
MFHDGNPSKQRVLAVLGSGQICAKLASGHKIPFSMLLSVSRRRRIRGPI